MVTGIEDSAMTLGLDLKSNGVGDGSPNSGATIANYPTQNRVAREVATDPNILDVAKFAVFVHELGNALAGQRYLNGTSKKKIGDYGAENKKLGINDPDAGAALEACVYGGIVGLRTGRVGTTREF